MTRKTLNLLRIIFTITSIGSGLAILYYDNTIRQLGHSIWPFIKWYLIIAFLAIPLLIYVDKRIHGILFKVLMINIMGTFVYKILPVVGTFLTVCFVLLLLSLIPLSLILLSEKYIGWMLPRELTIYLILSIIAILITFSSARTNFLASKYVMDNPADITRRFFREDLLKPVFYAINLALVVTTAILKYNHIKLWGLTDSGFDPFLQAFVTFIGFDTLVMTFRTAKQNVA